MWQGQRMLPEGWAQFVSTPAPAWKRPVYGGLFWVNGDGARPVPKSAYLAERRRRPAHDHHPDRTISLSSAWDITKAIAPA